MENSFCENVFRSSTKSFFVCGNKEFRLLQNWVEATHLLLEGDDLGWGAPGLGDDLWWGGEATRDAQECGGGPHTIPCLSKRRESSSLIDFLDQNP